MTRDNRTKNANRSEWRLRLREIGDNDGKRIVEREKGEVEDEKWVDRRRAKRSQPKQPFESL